MRTRPAPAGLPRPVVDVVFAGSDASGAEISQGRVGWSGGIDLRMRIERRLVVPEFEDDELVGVQGTLKDLELAGSQVPAARPGSDPP